MSARMLSDAEYLEYYYKKSLAYSRVDFTLATTTEDKIQYHLFTDPFQEEGLLFTYSSMSTLQIDRTLPMKIFFHGWTTNTTSPWYPLLKNAYFEKSPCNIIYVDWSHDGNQGYPESSGNINAVGKYIVEFLIDLDISPRNLHLIGHSLGSHLTGFIGKNYEALRGEKISRITALDPAGPAFYNTDPEHRLCEKDADFVDVVHTDIGHYGYVKPLGHVDFYPNGGRHQPGSEKSTDVNLSHARSTLFFVESVNCRVKAVEGKLDEDKLLVSPVESGKEITFGEDVEHNARGIYFLRTNPEEPFLRL